MSLLTFIDTHLEVDGVIVNVNLCRLNIKEHITTVIIEVTHSILI